MDIIDLASQREQADRELELANQQAKRSTRPPASHCLACGEPIPIARQQAVPGVQRCVECQEAYEHRSKG